MIVNDGEVIVTWITCGRVITVAIQRLIHGGGCGQQLTRLDHAIRRVAIEAIHVEIHHHAVDARSAEILILDAIAISIEPDIVTQCRFILSLNLDVIAGSGR